MATGFDAAVGFDSALVGFDGADLTPVQFDVDDLRVEILIPTSTSRLTWGDITGSVMSEHGVSIQRGRTTEDGDPSPASCSLVLNNTTGRYSPRNTSSTLYGLIGRNTPIRVGFGTPVVGEVNTGTASTNVTCPQVDASLNYGAVGVMAVGVMLPAGNLTDPAGYGTSTETDGTLFTVRRAFTTDSDIVPAATFTASVSSTWASALVAVKGGTYAASGGTIGNAGDSPAGISLASVAAGDAVVIVTAWTSDEQGRMLPPFFYSGTQQVELYLVADSGPSATLPRIAVWACSGRVGMGDVYFTGAQDGTTGASIQVGRFTTTSRYTPRFCGEVADWPVEWDYDANLITTPIQAAGVLRRMAQQTDVKSPLRASLGSHSDITAYWPMEDPAGSTNYAAAVGNRPAVFVNGGAPAENDDVAGSLPLPDFTARGARAPVDPGNPGPWGFGGVVAIPSSGTAAGANLITGECGGPTGTISSVGLEYTTSTVLTLKYVIGGVTTSASLGSLVTAFPAGIDGRQILIYIAGAQNGGNIDLSVTVINITPTETVAQLTGTTSPAGTIGDLQAVTLCVEAGSGSTLGTNGLSGGHLFVTSGASLSFAPYRRAAARGYAGSVLAEAAIVVARDGGFPITLCYPTGETRVAGPVDTQIAYTALQDIAGAGQALYQDAAGFPGLEYRPLSSIVSHPASLTLSYTGSVFCDRFGPVDDDATTTNDVTVDTTTGTQARYQVTTGALGAQPGGIGRYGKQFTYPLPADQALYVAQWIAGQGTIDAARFPYLTLRMNASGMSAVDMSALSIGDTVTLTNMPSFAGPSSVNVVVVGFTEQVDTAQWTVTLVTRLAAGYDVLIWDDATFGDWDEHNWGL